MASQNPVGQVPTDQATFSGLASLSATSRQQLQGFLDHPNTRLGGGMLFKVGIPLALMVMLPLKLSLLGILFVTPLSIAIAQKSGQIARAILKPVEFGQLRGALPKRLFAMMKEDLSQVFGNPNNPASQARLGVTKFQYLLSNINLLTKRLLHDLPVPPELVRFGRGFLEGLDLGPHNLGWIKHVPFLGKPLHKLVAGYGAFREQVLSIPDNDQLVRLMKRTVYKKFLRLYEPKDNWLHPTNLVRQALDTGVSQGKSVLEASHAPTLRAAYGNWIHNTRNDITTVVKGKSAEKIMEAIARRMPPIIGAPMLWIAKIADKLIEFFSRPR